MGPLFKFKYCILFCSLLAHDSLGLPETDLRNSITEIETEHGEYTNQLIEPYLELANVYLATGRADEAENALRRAQHLMHRDDGVYAMRQLEIVDLLTVMHLAQDKIKTAEAQQQFALQIGRHNTAENSPDLIPALLKLSQWQLETGQFPKSRSTLQETREIITSNFGDKDLRMVAVLRLEARTRLQQGICCAWENLEKAKAIINQNSTGSDEYADLLFELGDAYIIRRKADLAADIYNEAWQVLRQQLSDQPPADSPPRQLAMYKELSEHHSQKKTYKVDRDPFGYATYRQINHLDQYFEDQLEPQFFVIPMNENQYNFRIYDRRTQRPDEDPVRKMIGEPIQFDHKQLTFLLPVGYRNDFNMRELSILMDFTVNENGKTSDVLIVESNAPLRLDRLMKRVVQNSLFRPAFEAGEAVRTSHVKFTQTFSPFSDIISQHLPVSVD
jgi:tetratricopeptide (TPR) repeat protein